MERYFKFNDFNTFVDGHLILTSKELSPPEPKLYNVSIDGMDGSLDLTEALTGGVVYNDRAISAEFWTDYGNRFERVKLLNRIRQALHARKVKIIEPDDLEHYLVGRVEVKAELNDLAYATISIEGTCEPYRYNLTDTVRSLTVDSDDVTNLVLTNEGVKTLVPDIKVKGDITLTYGEGTVDLTSGNYKVPEIKLYSGSNVVGVKGNGTITFIYKEAVI